MVVMTLRGQKAFRSAYQRHQRTARENERSHASARVLGRLHARANSCEREWQRCPEPRPGPDARGHPRGLVRELPMLSDLGRVRS
jgi:hypothetical protein